MANMVVSAVYEGKNVLIIEIVGDICLIDYLLTQRKVER